LTGPLASTSANRHGELPATTAQQVWETLGDELDVILDGGPSAGLASTIIDCVDIPPRVLREGPISAAELLSPAAAARPARTGTEDRMRTDREGPSTEASRSTSVPVARSP